MFTQMIDTPLDRSFLKGLLYYADGSLTGSNLLDLKGALNGTPTNTTTAGDDRLGITQLTRTYDGTQYFTVDDSSSALRTALTANPIAVTLGIYFFIPTGTSQAWRYLISNVNSGTNMGFYLGFGYVTSEWIFGGNAANNTTWTGPTYAVHSLALNTWYLGMLTFSSNVITAYINGVAGSTVSTGNRNHLGTTPRTITISHSVEDTSSKWVGNIGEIMIWNRVLSAAEIKRLYSVMSKRRILNR